MSSWDEEYEEEAGTAAAAEEEETQCCPLCLEELVSMKRSKGIALPRWNEQPDIRCEWR
jgi:hypothetical protein